MLELRNHLAGEGGWWITVHYDDGTISVSGRYSHPRAKRRAAWLLEVLPGAIRTTVAPTPTLPAVREGARWVVLAFRSDGCRLAYGPFGSRKAACARIRRQALLAENPADYEYHVHYAHDAEAYRRTRRAV